MLKCDSFIRSLSLSLFPHTMCAINLFTTKEVLEAPFALVKGQQ